MSGAEYWEAISMTEAQGWEPAVRFPASASTIAELERRLGITLPEDYKQMLRDVGLLMSNAHDTHGIGRVGLDGGGGRSVLQLTSEGRENGHLAPTMVLIMGSGYGPQFVLDCADTARTGEAPVRMISAGGYQVETETVADSFGAFLLGAFLLDEVRAALDRRTA
jgi:hypothetical protein